MCVSFLLVEDGRLICGSGDISTHQFKPSTSQDYGRHSYSMRFTLIKIILYLNLNFDIDIHIKQIELWMIHFSMIYVPCNIILLSYIYIYNDMIMWHYINWCGHYTTFTLVFPLIEITIPIIFIQITSIWVPPNRFDKTEKRPNYKILKIFN